MSSFDPASVRQAVAAFTPRRPQKFQELSSAKEVIVELRQKRASYRAIAELLTQHCLPISKTAVAAYCRAASTDLFLDYFAEIDLPTILSALGVALTLVMPVNHELDSVDQLQRLAEHLGKTSSYLVVRNAAHSDSFALFDAAEIRVRLKDEFAGREIDMPRLQDWLVEALNREGITVTGATKHPAFSLLDRQRLLTWQRRLYAEFDSARELLLPEK